MKVTNYISWKLLNIKLGELTKSNNRSLIIASGVNVFVEKGVAEATVRDIIRSTGLASGTFYNYFKSKEEVLVAIFDDFASEIGENIRSSKHAVPKDFESFLRIKISTFLKISILEISILSGALSLANLALFSPHIASIGKSHV